MRRKRIIIAGSRNFTDYDKLEKEVLELVHTGFDNPIIISGTARGADQLGERFADNHGLQLVRMPADWEAYGKRAGYIRNARMADYASEGDGMLIAFWDGESSGTKNMIELAEKKGLEVNIIPTK